MTAGSEPPGELASRVWAAMDEAMVGRALEPGNWKRGARHIRVAVKRVLEDDPPARLGVHGPTDQP